MKKVAFLFMLLSSTCFAIMSVLVKSLDGIPALEIVFFRSFGTVLICFFILKYQRIRLLGDNPKLLISRGIVGSISLICFFQAIKLMPLGSAVSLRYLSPFVGIILSILILKEKVKSAQWFFIALAFVGAAMLKGFDLRISNAGLYWILTSAFFSGVVYFILRKIGKSEHPIVIVFYFTLIASLISGMGMIQHWVVPQDSSTWIRLLVLGILGFGGQIFMTKAFQLEETSKVAPLKYLEAVLAILIAWVWFGEGYQITPLLGMLLIMSGVIANSVLKNKSTV